MMPDLHSFAMYRLQEIALMSLAIVYLVRLVWLHQRFFAARDRQPRSGRRGTGPIRGAVYSLGLLGMPWHLESVRKHPFLYIQFVLFHLGVAAAIAFSVMLPYAPSWLSIPPFSWLIGLFIATGFVAALLRVRRRIVNPAMRAINSFDDYFSLILLTLWLALSFLSLVLGDRAVAVQDAFFWLTAFFLFYVPFSKISHYLYYPFARYLLGRTLGWRGVYPMVRVPALQHVKPRKS